MIISSIYNNLELKNNIDYLDGAILMVPFFAINYENNLDIESAIEVLKKKNKLIILGIDKISREKEFVDIKSFIEKYKDDNEILFYSSDLGIINLCMDLNIISRLIYDPKTMITNTEDAKCYLDFNLNSLGISNEITLDDVIKIKNISPDKFFYMIFGKRIMFYSKRDILSIYLKKYNLKEKNIFDMSLYDDDNRIYKIVENKSGLSIYRDYFISLYKYLDEIKDIRYLYLDSFDLDEAIFSNVLKNYHEYLNKKISKEVFINNINSFNINIKDGFLFKDTIYQKEEIENE